MKNSLALFCIHKMISCWWRQKEKENPSMPNDWIELRINLLKFIFISDRSSSISHIFSCSLSISIWARRNLWGVSVVSQSLEFITNIVRSYFFFFIRLFIKWFANAHGAYMQCMHNTHIFQSLCLEFLRTKRSERKRAHTTETTRSSEKKRIHLFMFIGEST